MDFCIFFVIGIDDQNMFHLETFVSLFLLVTGRSKKLLANQRMTKLILIEWKSNINQIPLHGLQRTPYLQQEVSAERQ